MWLTLPVCRDGSLHIDASTMLVICAKLTNVSEECKHGPSWNITAICMNLLHPSYMPGNLFPFWACYLPIHDVMCFLFSIVKNNSCFGASLYGGSRIIRNRCMLNRWSNWVRQVPATPCSLISATKWFFSSNEHFLFPGLVAEVNERGCPFPLSVAIIFHHAVISCVWWWILRPVFHTLKQMQFFSLF